LIVSSIYKFKGTVRVISSDHLCKDGSARFTTVSLKLCLVNYELGIIVRLQD